jgi:N-acetyl-alpha-D-muramate 1-phosphate uridylyltransferase
MPGMKAMILAAGRGERLRPMTDTVPKPLVPVHGKPMIVYHIEKLARLGITDIVINHAWLGHKLPETLGDGSRWGVKLHYSAEHQALETGGGIKQALPLLGDSPFLVLNGDIFIDRLPLTPEAVDDGFELAPGVLAHLWLVDNPPQHPQGDFVLGDDGLVSCASDDGRRLTFSGMGIYRPALFDGTPDGAFALGPLLRNAMALGRIGGEYFDGLWCDVGTIDRLRTLEAMLGHSQ